MGNTKTSMVAVSVIDTFSLVLLFSNQISLGRELKLKFIDALVFCIFISFSSRG